MTSSRLTARRADLPTDCPTDGAIRHLRLLRRFATSRSSRTSSRSSRNSQAKAFREVVSPERKPKKQSTKHDSKIKIMRNSINMRSEVRKTQHKSTKLFIRKKATNQAHKTVLYKTKQEQNTLRYTLKLPSRVTTTKTFFSKKGRK